MNHRLLSAALATWLVAMATAAPGQTPYEVRPRGEPAAPGLLNAPSSAAPLSPPPYSPPPAKPTAPAQPFPVQPAVALTPPEARQMPKLALASPKDAASPTSRGGGSSIATILAGLAVVLGLFFAVAALLRRGAAKPARLLPAEAVEMLGRINLPGRQQGHLIRVGNKVTLVSFFTGGAEPLVEITDPLEVDRLAGLCRQHDPHGATGSFRGIVEQFFREKPGTALPLQRGAEDDDV